MKKYQELCFEINQQQVIFHYFPKSTLSDSVSHQQRSEYFYSKQDPKTEAVKGHGQYYFNLGTCLLWAFVGSKKAPSILDIICSSPIWHTLFSKILNAKHKNTKNQNNCRFKRVNITRKNQIKNKMLHHDEKKTKRQTTRRDATNSWRDLCSIGGVLSFLWCFLTLLHVTGWWCNSHTLTCGKITANYSTISPHLSRNFTAVTTSVISVNFIYVGQYYKSQMYLNGTSMTP